MKRETQKGATQSPPFPSISNISKNEKRPTQTLLPSVLKKASAGFVSCKRKYFTLFVDLRVIEGGNKGVI